MRKIITCPCGFVIVADSDEALVARAQQHAREAHAMELSREDALAMARPA
jgi:predicted small metal-binding protein